MALGDVPLAEQENFNLESDEEQCQEFPRNCSTLISRQLSQPSGSLSKEAIPNGSYKPYDPFEEPESYKPDDPFHEQKSYIADDPFQDKEFYKVKDPFQERDPFEEQDAMSLESEDEPERFSQARMSARSRSSHTGSSVSDSSRAVSSKYGSRQGGSSKSVSIQPGCSKSQGLAYPFEEEERDEETESMQSRSRPLNSEGGVPIMEQLHVYFEKHNIQVPRKTASDYIFLRILGEGSVGYVALAKEVESERYLAIKVICRRDVIRRNMMPNICRERDILYNMSYLKGGSPWVMNLHFSFQDKSHYFFVMQYASLGNLATLLRENRRLKKSGAVYFGAQILAGLEWLHSHQIIHRDIKPQNILVKEDYHLMISDFSSAKDMDPKNEYEENTLYSDDEEEEEAGPSNARPNRTTFVGTALYISPDVLNREPVSPCCDYWALGCIIFEMLAGRSPFAATNAMQCLGKIRRMDFSIPTTLSKTSKDIISKLLVANSKTRLGARGIKEIKNHPFFKKADWKNLQTKQPPAHIRHPREAPGEPPVPEHANPGLNSLEESRLMGIDVHFYRFASVYERESGVAARNAAQNRERERLLAIQRQKNIYHRFVNDKLIVKQGILEKKKGLFARARMFLLTDGPDLWYIEPEHLIMKGKIPFTRQMRTQPVSFDVLLIHTPHRTYHLTDSKMEADQWAHAIDNVKRRHWEELPDEEEIPEIEPPRSGRHAIWVR